MRRMPSIFIGHGSPMNAIEDNYFTRNWQQIAAEIPKPKAILAISAHWFTLGSRITDNPQPKMVYDMYGFPQALYEVDYPAVGSTELAHETRELIHAKVEIDNSWGYDHGTWSVLCKMYPHADIPVYQLSIDSRANAEAHFAIGKELSILRDKGVLILGSGNVVHNLGKINWEMHDGYPWAIEFDSYIKNLIMKKAYDQVINYQAAGKSAEIAFVTPEHYLPLLYVLGATRADDQLSIYNDTCILGSMSMTSYLFK